MVYHILILWPRKLLFDHIFKISNKIDRYILRSLLEILYCLKGDAEFHRYTSRAIGEFLTFYQCLLAKKFIQNIDCNAIFTHISFHFIIGISGQCTNQIWSTFTLVYLMLYVSSSLHLFG